MSGPSELSFSALGEAAILGEALGPANYARQTRVWELAHLVREWPGVGEVTVGMNSILVSYEPKERSQAEMAAALAQAWQTTTGRAIEGKRVEIPVRYGGGSGPDLDAVARLTGLSPGEVVARHCAAEYTVFAIGSEPGFAYLAGLDAALQVPRLSTPRLSVPAGSVIIAGEQSGVHPIRAPCGWNVIGRTDVMVFDIARPSPVLFAPGDKVRFTVLEQLER